MALTAFSVSASASLLPFKSISGGPKPKQWRQLFHSSSKRFTTSSKPFIASSSMGGNQGLREVPEAQTETPPNTYYSWPDKKNPRVCILGGGFGGLYTALRLESLVWPDDKKPQILLVDQSERFVFKPMLYELLSREVSVWEIAPRFSELLANTGVQFFKDRVKLLTPSDHLGMSSQMASSCGGTVLLESGLLIEYDWLVLALGAEPKLDVVPGAAEFALPFSTLEDACRVDKKLSALERRNFGEGSLIRIAVVGCGYSGVELAATVSERLGDRGIVQAINVEATICPAAPPGNREAALKVLSARKVQLLLGYFVRCIRRVDEDDTSVMHVDSSSILDIASQRNSGKYILELQPAVKGLEGKSIEADLVLWTVGSKPLLPQLEPSRNPQELPLNARGQAETDETLRVKGHPRIFALGDSSALRDSHGRLLPATAQVAFQQADFAGWNLWAAINDRPLLPFRLEIRKPCLFLSCNPELLDVATCFSQYISSYRLSMET